MMSGGLLKGLPSEKSFILKSFFGQSGNIADPWHDDGRPEHMRYRLCATELRDSIQPGMDRLIDYLDACRAG